MDENKIRSLIAQGEGTRIELKKSLAQLPRIVKAACAFANTEGGYIIAGVRKDGTLVGVQIGDTTIERVVNTIMDNIDPPLYPSVEVGRLEGKSLFVVSVPESDNKPHTAYRIPHKRVGSVTKEMKRDEYERFLLQRRREPFDQRRVREATLEDLDTSKVDAYLGRRLEARPATTQPAGDIQQLLTTALRSTRRINEMLVPTVVGILFFGRSPQSFLPTAKIRLARFEGSTPLDFIDQAEVEGTLPEMLDEAEKFVRRNTRSAIRIVGFNRITIHEYPYAAAREALVNAVAHRDYEAPGVIQVHIFNDRLEVHSPGEPLAPIDELEGAHIPRNGVICQRLHDIGEMEQYGTGITRMKHWMQEHGLPYPDFDVRAGFFRVTFSGPGERLLDLVREEHVLDLREVGLNDRQIEALGLMVNQGEKLSTRTYTTRFDVSRKTAYSDLNTLVEKGFAVKKGRGRNVHYETP